MCSEDKTTTVDVYFEKLKFKPNFDEELQKVEFLSNYYCFDVDGIVRIQISCSKISFSKIKKNITRVGTVV